jgi:hypothetical protein
VGPQHFVRQLLIFNGEVPLAVQPVPALGQQHNADFLPAHEPITAEPQRLAKMPAQG